PGPVPTGTIVEMRKSRTDFVQRKLCQRAPGRQCLRMADYVTVTGPTDGAPAPPQRGNVGYPQVASPESFQRAGVRPERAKSVIDHHVTPEQAGEIFAKTKPRLAVYSHIVQPDASEQDLIPPTRKNYAGRVEVGEDLMVIEVGE